MGDLTNPRWIYAKGFLFLFAGLLAGTGLIADNPTPRTVLLLALCVWCLARFYYFCFYVIEHYVDPGYRFAGLSSFARYHLRRRRHRAPLRLPPGEGRGEGARKTESRSTPDAPSP